MAARAKFYTGSGNIGEIPCTRSSRIPLHRICFFGCAPMEQFVHAAHEFFDDNKFSSERRWAHELPLCRNNYNSRTEH
jgi:hypothetical protein